MKRLYWIDDDMQHMQYVVYGVIKRLWKLDNVALEGIESKILMFGNAYADLDTDELPTEEDENSVFAELFNFFIEECMEYDGPDIERKTFYAKKELIKDPICFLYKRENASDLEKYKAMKCVWLSEKLSDSESENYKEAKKEAKELIKRMKIESESVVGIDIMLLYGDRERLCKKQRILSMELCYQLSSGGIKCFMYSTDADVEELVQNWEQTYSTFYNVAPVEIYKRNELMQKGNTNIWEKIEKMLV